MKNESEYKIVPWQSAPFNDTAVKTTCPYCGVGCGLIIDKSDAGQISVKGDPRHPANLGRLCSKGSALAETLHHRGRLLQPQLDGQEVDWQTAVQTIAEKFQFYIDNYGPDSIAFYVSGQLMTEDYYAANKLMKGFIGSANIDTNSRLCMSSAVAAYKRAFGEDVVPCQYSDLEQAQLIVITGSNLAWCHPVLFQRIAAARKLNTQLKIVVIDPRKTQTASIADLHLSIHPGSDAYLFNGLFDYLVNQHQTDDDFIQNSVTYRSHADDRPPLDMRAIATICGIDTSELEQFYRCFAQTEKTVTLYSQGINQSSSGTDKANSIINCHLLTGRIGKPGCGPFSITGQPNAMGGREVGGLANQLAAHMDIANPRHRQLVQSFWQSPRIAQQEGLKAVDLMEAVDSGQIKAIWIMATNPVVSMPDAEKVRQALLKCPLVIVSDCMENTDTMAYADIKLPAITWGERDGTVTNSERCISRQRAFTNPPGEARPDWWIISQIAACMGYQKHFDYNSTADIFKEYCQLTAYQNDDERLLNLSFLTAMTPKQYQNLQPVYWPEHEADKSHRHIYAAGRFTHTDKKARIISISAQLPAKKIDKQFPLRLNSGRIRDHWHTMTRTGWSARLSAHISEPYVEIHPQDAERYRISANSLVKVISPVSSSIIVRAMLSNKQQLGSIFVPIHWNRQFSAQAGVSTLYHAIVDPISGQPESKHGIAALEVYQPRWFGFIISVEEISSLKPFHYWSRIQEKNAWRYEVAGDEMVADWSLFFHENFKLAEKNAEWVELYDQSRQHYRGFQLKNNQILSCFFIQAENKLPSRDWLISLFDKEIINSKERKSLLQASAIDTVASGKTVCSCFNIGENQLQTLIREKNLKTIEDIGRECGAGSNCGSCRPELSEFLG